MLANMQSSLPVGLEYFMRSSGNVADFEIEGFAMSSFFPLELAFGALEKQGGGFISRPRLDLLEVCLGVCAARARNCKKDPIGF